MRTLKTLWLLLLILLWASWPLQAQGVGAVGVSAQNTIRILTGSSDQCTVYAETFSGSPLLFSPAQGVGGCVAVGQTITGSVLTGGTGTILGISAQPAQTVPSTTSATTHTNTTLDGIATAVCNQVKKYMWINGTNIVGKANGSGVVSATPTYTTSDCGAAGGNAAGTVTMSAAASGSATSTDFNFTPAILVSVNANATHNPQSDFSTFIAGANQDVLTVTYTIADRNGADRTVPVSFTQTPVTGSPGSGTTTDYPITSTSSSALVNGLLQNVSVIASTGSPEKGAIGVVIQLMQGSSVIMELGCGSPTARHAVTMGHCDPSEMKRERLIAQPRPIAGAQSIITVPNNVSWQIVGGLNLFLASATAGYRSLSVTFLDREGIPPIVLGVGSSQLLVASDSAGLTFGAGVPGSSPTANYPGGFAGGQWSILHAPLPAVQATISQAAPGIGFRNVVECIGGSMVATTAGAGESAFQLRDGASGAGGVKWNFNAGVTNVAGATASDVTFCPPNPWRMSANTITTFETSLAPATGNTAVVSMKGYVEAVVQGILLPLPMGLTLRGGGKAAIIFSGGNNVDDIWTEPQVHIVEQWNIVF